MRCRALDCRENENGYCSCESYIEIDETGTCDTCSCVPGEETRNKRMNTCNSCRANKVCDHTIFGFENCGNFIPETSDVQELVNDLQPILTKMLMIFHKQEDCQHIWADRIIEQDLVELKNKYTEDKYANM